MTAASFIICSYSVAATSAETGTFDDAADFLGHFDDVTAGFQDQRRVGRDAVDEAQVIQLPDFIHIGCIDKKLHGILPFGARADDARAALLFRGFL
jgi:hypothetical protein